MMRFEICIVANEAVGSQEAFQRPLGNHPLEVLVQGRGPHLLAAPLQRGLDLLRAEMSIVLPEELEDQAPRLGSLDIFVGRFCLKKTFQLPIAELSFLTKMHKIGEIRDFLFSRIRF